MSATWIYPFILFAGVMQALGGAMNAQLKESLVNPWLAALVSFGPVFFFFCCLFAMFPRPLPTAQDLAAMPWWAPLAGLAGAFAVFGMLTLIGKVGAGPFMGLTVTASILTSLLIDHFGLMGVEVHALNLARVVGGALLVAGVALIAIF